MISIGLFFSGFLALGIVLITLLKSKLDLHSILFGDILGVTINDVMRTSAIAVIVLSLVKLFYKELLFYTFDPLGAQAIGLPVQGIHFGLTSAITLTIITSMQAVGVILVVSLLIGPGITAYLLVKELHQMIVYGAIVGILSSVTGMYISYYLNVPSGASIVLVVSGLFLLALLFSPTQGILTRLEIANRSTMILRQLKYLNRQ